MGKKFYFALALAILVAVTFFCLLIFVASKPPTDFPGTKISRLSIGTTTITLEVRDTDETRTSGLSGRNSLPSNHGLLFVFDYPGFWGFWMKDMKFPIDIVWLDQNFLITHIEKNVLPETYPKVFTPKEKSLYVLEVNAGTSLKFDLKVGDRLGIR